MGFVVWGRGTRMQASSTEILLATGVIGQGGKLECCSSESSTKGNGS